MQVTGDCLYPDWTAAFVVPFIHRNNAIVVLPNYRLTPEASGTEILEDLNDFWTWFHSDKLYTYLTSQGYSDLSVDYDHVLATGESAGGYAALMSALTLPEGTLKVILTQYPMTDSLRHKPSPLFFGMPAPGPDIAEKHIAAMTPGTSISSAVPPSRAGLSYSLAAYGRYLEFFGKDDKLWPIGRIAEAKSMPPTWIVHGDADAVVDIEDSKSFVDKWKKARVEGEVRLYIQPGGDHGFDIPSKESEDEWLREGLVWVESKWLA